jgi:hypothetical protein
MKHKSKVNIANQVSTKYFPSANIFARPRELCEIAPLIFYRMGFHSAHWCKSTMEWLVGRILRQGDRIRPIDNLDNLLCPIFIKNYQLMWVMQNRWSAWESDKIPIADSLVRFRMVD